MIQSEIKSLLQPFFDVIAVASNVTTLWVNLKSLKLRFFKQVVNEALKDTTEIEKIVDELFYRKQVMWERADKENADWCIASLKDLRNKCDVKSEYFLSKHRFNDKQHFLAALLRTWGNYSDIAYKDIVKSDMSNQALETALKNFRKKSYPIVATLLLSLPDENLSKGNGFKKLEEGVKNSKLTIKQIIPTWSLEP